MGKIKLFIRKPTLDLIDKNDPRLSEVGLSYTELFMIAEDSIIEYPPKAGEDELVEIKIKRKRGWGYGNKTSLRKEEKESNKSEQTEPRRESKQCDMERGKSLLKGQMETRTINPDLLRALKSET